MNTVRALVCAALLCVLPGLANAHGGEPRGERKAPAEPEQFAWGIAGDPSRATRTIDIRMSDRMRFAPDRITVKQGQTVRLRVRNDGKLPHEMVIGTKAVLDEHAAQMMKFPEMEHEAPYMAHVAPGKTESIVWTFNRAGPFDFACLIAGHYQAGMTGRILVAK